MRAGAFIRFREVENIVFDFRYYFYPIILNFY